MSEPVQRIVVATGNHMKFKQDIAKAREEMAAAGIKDIEQRFDVHSGAATLTGHKP